MLRRPFAYALFVATVAVGCAPKEPVVSWERMGSSAPAYGSSPELQSWAGFLAGRWAISELQASGLGKSGNWKEAARPGEGDPGDYFEFTSDGKFTLQYGPYPVAGKWKAAGDAVQLEYSTLNGKPLQGEISRIRSQASSGRQGDIAGDIFLDGLVDAIGKMNAMRLGQDAKTLTFAQGPSGGNPVDAMALGMVPTLERLSKQAKKS